jgi:glyoxylase-like metal-dependent hydrolase (beta-lactamase superfamily II)
MLQQECAGMSTKKVGEFTVTAVSDGVLYSNHDVILGVDKEESARLTGVPYGKPLPLDVNSFLIRHNGKLIVSDAGTGQGLQPVQKNLGQLPANLRAIGASPEAIDIVMLTHLHSDHSLGLVDERNRPVFPKAELYIHEVEAAFWLDRELQPGDSERIVGNSKKQRAVLAPYRGRIRRVQDGQVLPGITAMLRPGHTPGHTNWLIESGGERLLIWGDIVHLAAVQLARPEARLIYDVDTDLAAATRAKVLDWCASERLMVAGAHLAWPGFGRVARNGGRFVIEAA